MRWLHTRVWPSGVYTVALAWSHVAIAANLCGCVAKWVYTVDVAMAAASWHNGIMAMRLTHWVCGKLALAVGTPTTCEAQRTTTKGEVVRHTDI
jgi:hypothetical protein